MNAGQYGEVVNILKRLVLEQLEISGDGYRLPSDKEEEFLRQEHAHPIFTLSKKWPLTLYLGKLYHYKAACLHCGKRNISIRKFIPS